MFGLPGGMEWIIIGLVLLLLFGKRLPEVMRSVGKGINEFKHGMNEIDAPDRDQAQPEPHDASYGQPDAAEPDDASAGDAPPDGDGKNTPS